MDGDSYVKTPATSFNRHKERGTYDAETVHNIVNTTSVCHVSFMPSPDDPFPAILPMIAQIGHFPDSQDDAPSCYLHGYVSSRLMKLGADGTSSSGVPVCVAATKVDGFLLALTPFNHSYNYRSVMLQGTATIVDDDAEKMWAMELITDSVVPGRWANTRVPPDKPEITSTRVMKVRIERASAKIHTGNAKSDRKDLKNEEVVNGVWTGVVPVWETFGTPIPSPDNRVKDIPAHVADFVKNENLNAEELAVGAARAEE
ncbi:uncharacterized protein K452DRAFT_323148 [Aplosporella prunicola CBS 121167]|uniref:Flavin-nucleotide-binding protein n=1 Tax=Aplosporella prunicola CBS 121167 TaxID=1176127 RepID=A0A6A6ATH5_9PEZI|nr:uncharacterized protein K452DRAFT_323148 [Aplosporella prunicola CBS 121167]KAF2135269.1 hypothetical protein K452DRAFT_323148 [Aplosporella prunicola CBS 121167]